MNENDLIPQVFFIIMSMIAAAQNRIHIWTGPAAVEPLTARSRFTFPRLCQRKETGADETEHVASPCTHAV